MWFDGSSDDVLIGLAASLHLPRYLAGTATGGLDWLPTAGQCGAFLSPSGQLRY